MCDVVTLEFENVPVAAVDHLSAKVPVHPGASVLRTTQDRVFEKTALQEFSIPVTGFAKLDDANDLAAITASGASTGILKTRRMGYDGKGQTRITACTELAAGWQKLGQAPCILEALVDFSAELSVMVARNASGEITCYPPVENTHENHILKTTIAPMDLPVRLRDRAVEIATAIAEKIGLIGIMGVEMFLTRDGQILVNELAPRPHNSGHWTIEGAQTSQFEQQVRAICNLPLGATTPVGTRVRMDNLLGFEWQDAWLAALKEPGAHLHLYGKAETKAGRKMGHITRIEEP